MNAKPLALQLAVLSLASSAQGQGTFTYDQQSAFEGIVPEPYVTIQTNQPLGQSFTPSLSGVGFVRLWLGDDRPGNSTGATVYVNLRSDSITGPILGSTDPVFMPDGFGAGGSQSLTNFFFPLPVTVTPSA